MAMVIASRGIPKALKGCKLWNNLPDNQGCTSNFLVGGGVVSGVAPEGGRGLWPPVGEKFYACRGIFNGNLCSYAL